MNPILEGALIGLALALVLVAAEYMLLNKAAQARAKALHRAPQLEEIERRRIASMARFSVLLPFIFAFFFWLIWG
ncbi:MAG TPA: hypothetical protein VEL04_07025 [Burkholderiales bacterium]|nr:hypothetical protein [Burkholderiales bacterium]